MRILALITMAGGVACGAMAGWGMFTDAGRRHFDEMAGIIPLAAGALSIAALTAGAIAYAIAVRADRRRRGFEVGSDEKEESHQSDRAAMTTKIPKSSDSEPFQLFTSSSLAVTTRGPSRRRAVCSVARHVRHSRGAGRRICERARQ